MTVQQLRYVLTIAEMGSLNKAAEVLYVSQPSLTSAVRELEDELGITLFNRGARGVTVTNDGAEFIPYARDAVAQFDRVIDKYAGGGKVKKKFGISTQHYSFAVKSFVEMVKRFDTEEYEFAIRETKTREVIDDVATGVSEIGILYLSDFNRKALEKIFRSCDLEFHHLIDCRAYVYLHKSHPLAKHAAITFGELADYPCLAFEQGGSGSFYYAEEILSTNDYPRMIKANDRATMLNLMVGLRGYTLCSGIICEELNGGDYAAVPFDTGDDGSSGVMEIGYIVKKNTLRSPMAEMYADELSRYLKENVRTEA